MTMTRREMPLADFQRAFADALFAVRAGTGTPLDALVAQPAFAVYRNTVMKACVDALQANFPAVARLVGEPWFRAAATEYVSRERPREPSLLSYGATFAEFLDGFAPASTLPYLADVARVDRFWTEAHAAADAPSLGAEELVGLAPDALARAVLQLHPAARWAWFANAPIHSIWSRNRAADPGDGEIAWHAEGVLVARPFGAVRAIAIDGAACRFLDACAAGRNVAAAMDAALDADGEADPARIVATLLSAGAARRISLPPGSLR